MPASKSNMKPIINEYFPVATHEAAAARWLDEHPAYQVRGSQAFDKDGHAVGFSYTFQLKNSQNVILGLRSPRRKR
jgi:hypothetical protein